MADAEAERIICSCIGLDRRDVSPELILRELRVAPRATKPVSSRAFCTFTDLPLLLDLPLELLEAALHLT